MTDTHTQKARGYSGYSHQNKGFVYRAVILNFLADNTKVELVYSSPWNGTEGKKDVPAQLVRAKVVDGNPHREQ